MPRNPKIEEAKTLYKQGKKLVEIASILEVPEGSVRRWKSTYKWDGERSAKKASVRKSKDDDIVIKNRNEDLTEKQQLFCLYYVKKFNATKAYQKAYGVKYETAMVEGCKTLRNPKVIEYIDELKQNKLNRAMLKAEDIFQKYIDIAHADITDYVSFGQEEVQVMSMYGPVFEEDEKTGEKKPVTKVINTVKFRDSDEVDGSLISEISQGKDGARIKLVNKEKAMDFLAKHSDLATAEQKARIAKLKAETKKIESESAKDNDKNGPIKVIFNIPRPEEE
ncbi:MAG: terminase small subunit [Aminipila sp.]